MIVFSQNSICTTSGNYPDALRVRSSTVIASSYKVNVFFHIVRNSDGTGGQSVSVLTQIMNNLSNAYSAQSVYFVNTGYDEIKNNYYTTNFYNAPNDPSNLAIYNSLVSQNVICNAINVYLLDDNSAYIGGMANGIPGTALVVGGKLSPNDGSTPQPIVPSLVVAHEIGHCLGLYHTFETSMGAELANESNCSTAGDLVCDTNASYPLYNFTENSQCAWTVNYTDANGQTYNPDPHNIMAYVRPSCMQYFTNGQGARFRSVISSSSVLADVLVPIITTSPVVCSSGSTFTISDVPSGLAVTWQATPANLFATSSGSFTSTGSSQNITLSAANSSAFGSGAFSVTVTSGTCGTMNVQPQAVWVGKSNIYTYDANGNKTTQVPQLQTSVDSHNTIDIGSDDESASFSWVVRPTAYVQYGIYGIGQEIGFFIGAEGNYTFTARASNGCGTGNPLLFVVNVTGYGNGGNGLVAYPNPATSALTVQVADSLPAGNNSETTIQPYQLSLINNFSETVYSVQSSSKETTIPLNGVPNGVYYLNVHYRGKMIRKQIVVNK